MAVSPSIRSSSHDGAVDHASDPTTRPTITKPVGTVDGDILYLLMYVEDANSGDLAGRNLAGFTLIRDKYVSVAGKEHHNVTAWKRASSEPASYSPNWTNDSWYDCVILAVKDAVATGDPNDAIAEGTQGTGATIVNPAVVTTLPNTFLISFLTEWNGAGTVSIAGGWTEDYDNNDAAHVASNPFVGPGDTGTVNWTIPTSNGSVAIMIAVAGTSVVEGAGPTFKFDFATLMMAGD